MNSVSFVDLNKPGKDQVSQALQTRGELKCLDLLCPPVLQPSNCALDVIPWYGETALFKNVTKSPTVFCTSLFADFQPAI